MEFILSSGGEMGRRMRDFDWSRTSLGPMQGWPQSLKTSISICLASNFPIVLHWGPEYVLLYNDAYSQILGAKHPRAVGQSCRTCWPEIWETIGPMLDSVVNTGNATWSDDMLLRLERFGYPEECYFSFSFSPIQVEEGAVGGIFTAVMETTDKVIGERRLRTLRDLAARSRALKREEDAWRIAAEMLAGNDTDVPFAILCKTEGETLRLEEAAGIGRTHPLCHQICDGKSALFQKAMQVSRTGQSILLEDLASFADALPHGAWEIPPARALLLPIAQPGHGSSGVLLAAVSPAKALDEDHRMFFDQLARQIATSIADARAYEEERQRTETLAELDHAKTLFFNNVSHEFRTPLTLMLGPLEELAANHASKLGAEEHHQAEVACRNARRLLKLVNTLLDFSRIETGCVQAVCEPTDLAVFTSEIASSFRSVIEKAGLRFSISCDPLVEPVYVDRAMWEKIVLNLLSNAFKFTFNGQIAVSLKQAGHTVELAVRDTGVGIAEEDQAHLFERFYMIHNIHARTYEGSGIGLPLVEELVKLHGGNIHVESAAGHGSTFTVEIPMGAAHCPPGLAGAVHTLAPAARSTQAYVYEAESWTNPGHDPAGESSRETPADSAKASMEGPVRAPQEAKELIVIADDNADMRDYIAHLLQKQYKLHIAVDGEQAIDAVQKLHPDLVLADVMMPGLDGFGVLNRIRSDPALKSTPVILLSAQAGEDSRIFGIENGADDYLAKPFSARELLARVSTHLKMANLRRKVAENESRLRAEAERERHRIQKLLAQAPAAIGFLSGPDLRWVYVNQEYLHITGRSNAKDFLGKTLLESLPEFQGQPHLELLNEVYRTGRPYVGHEMKILLDRSATGQPDEGYFDFVYQPVVNTDEQIEGILVHAVEVTDRVMSRRAIERSEARLRKIVETTPECVMLVTREGVVQQMNSAGLSMTGADRADSVIGRQIYERIASVDRERFRNFHEHVCQGERASLEFDIVGFNGRRRQVEAHSAPLQNTDGSITHLAVIRDVTDRKAAERALIESEQRLRVITDATPSMIWMSSVDNLRFYFNKSWLDFVGRRLEEEAGKGWEENVYPDDLPRCLQAFDTSFAARLPFETEYRLRRRDGQYRWILDHGAPRYAPDGAFEGYVGGSSDIHDQKIAEQKLRESELWLAGQKQAFQAAVNGASLEHCLKILADTAIEYFDGVPRCAFFIVNLDGKELHHVIGMPDEYARLIEGFRISPDSFACGLAAYTGEPCITPDVLEDPRWRSWHWVAEQFDFRGCWSFPVKTSAGKSVGTFALYFQQPRGATSRDQELATVLTNAAAIIISRHQETEQRARAEEVQHRLAAIVESSDDAIISKDLTGTITSWNPAAEKIFGYTAQEMVGHSILKIVPPEFRPHEQRMLASIAHGERIEHFETARITKAGDRIDVSLTVSPIKDETDSIVGVAKITRDITRQKNAEQALHNTERLAAVGRLAATVAHEINNPLAAVMNLVYLCKQTAVREDVREYLSDAEEELRRIAHLTKQTLSFYRESRVPAAIRLGSVIDSLIGIFASKARNKSVTVRSEIRQDPEIYVVPGELRQLLGNILNNSIDAVDTGGQICIRLSTARGHGRPGGVRLTIADSGSGIPVQIRQRIFEPFFTTKQDVGTGLGLWICKSIVDKYGGSIRIWSSTLSGKSGTAISVFLPVPMQSHEEDDSADRLAT